MSDRKIQNIYDYMHHYHQFGDEIMNEKPPYINYENQWPPT